MNILVDFYVMISLAVFAFLTATDMNTPWWYRLFVMPPVVIVVALFMAYNHVFTKITGRSIQYK